MSIKTLILTMAVLLGPVLSCAAAEETDVPTLMVSGEGEVSAAPDMATIILGVETRDESAAVAAAENARLMNQTMEALVNSGVSPEDMETYGYEIGTEDDRLWGPVEDSEGPTIFVVSNLVEVKLNFSQGMDLSRVIDGAVAAGANDVSVEFGIRDEKSLQQAALQKAIADAMSDARIMADAAGVALGTITRISEGYSMTYGGGGSFAYAAADAAPMSPTPLIPGDVEISAQVDMDFEIL